MIDLPPEFESDIQGQNLNLYPIVDIRRSVGITIPPDIEIEDTGVVLQQPIYSDTPHITFLSSGASQARFFKRGDYLKIDDEYLYVTDVIWESGDYQSWIMIERGIFQTPLPEEHLIGTVIERITTTVDIFISTKDVTLGLIHYMPLLLNMPSIKESMDFENRNYKISNVTLKISNYEYEGKRFSDYAGNLINTSAVLSWVSQSESILEVYNGFIRRYSHDDESVTLQLEDSTQRDLHKDVPVARLVDSDEVLNKYKLKPIPMVYGHVDRSPCVVPDITTDILTSFNILPDRVIDYEEHSALSLEGIITKNDIYWDNAVSRNSHLMIYTGESYLNVLETPIYSDDLLTSLQYTLGNTNQYIITNPESSVPEGGSAGSPTPNTISENIVQIYEEDNQIYTIEPLELTGILVPLPDYVFILLFSEAMPGLNWEEEDFRIVYGTQYLVDPDGIPDSGDEYYDYSIDYRFGQTKLIFKTSEAFEDYPQREALSFGENAEITERVESLGSGGYFNLGCWATNYYSVDTKTRMHQWTDGGTFPASDWVSPNNSTTNTKKYISNSMEIFTGEASAWTLSFEPGTSIGSESYIETFKNSMSVLKIYYLDKFTNRDFYANVNGRTDLNGVYE